MLKIDMHVHTCFSRDGYGAIEDLFEAILTRGLDGLAITDHDTTTGALLALELATEEYPDLVVIPGEEITTQFGHLLAFGIKKTIEPGLHPLEAIKKVKKQKGLVAVPHPFHLFRHGLWGFKKYHVDAVEVYNAKYIIGLGNYMARRLNFRLNLPEIGGSDSHNPDMVGFGFTLVDAEPDARKILRAIQEGKSTAAGEKIPVGVYINHIKKRVEAHG